MAPEQPDLSKDKPEIPVGVPGENDTSFAAMNADLHRRLRDRYKTDDPDYILGLLDKDSREKFIAKYGSPHEMMEENNLSLKRDAQERSVRIATIRTVRMIQESYNATLSRIHELQAHIAQLDHKMMELSDASFLNIRAQFQRVQLTTESARLRSELSLALHNQENQIKVLKNFGFNAPDEGKYFTVKED